jgi:hypothetical protein
MALPQFSSLIPQPLKQGIENVGGYIGQKSREFWNTPVFLGATRKNMAENLVNFPGDFIRGLPDAGKSFEEYTRTIGVPDIPFVNLAIPEEKFPTWLQSRKVGGERLPTGMGLAWRASDPFSTMIGETIAPTSQDPLLKRTAMGIYEGRNLYTALRSKGVHPAIALAAEMATPSAINIVGAEKAARRFAGLSSPDVNDLYKAVQASLSDTGIALQPNQVASIVAGFDPQFDEQGNYVGMGYNEARAAKLMGLSTLGMAVGGSIVGPKATGYEKFPGYEQVSPYSPDTAYKILSDVDAKMTGIPEGKAVDVMKHDTLYSLYPELADVDVKLNPGQVASNTFTDPNTGKVSQIELGIKGMTATDMKNALAHELGTHAVGKIEGFKPGGVPQDFRFATPDQTSDVYDYQQAAMLRRMADTGAGMDKAVQMWNQESFEPLKPEVVELAKSAPADQLEQSFANVRSDADMWRWQQYRNLPGEVMGHGVEQTGNIPQQDLEGVDVFARGMYPGATLGDVEQAEALRIPVAVKPNFPQ